jgi:hypothetical protein
MTKQNLIKTSIAFGGFYESIHDSNIEHMIEAYNQDGNYPEYNFDNIDYKKTHQSYIESWTSNFESYLLNELEVNIDFKKLKLWSPKYYNYDTDVIDCFIDIEQMKSLNKKILLNDDFLQWLKNRTTSCDGFISFYSYNDAVNNKDNKLIMYILEYLANQYNKEFIYDSIEFDIHLIKEAA